MKPHKSGRGYPTCGYCRVGEEFCFDCHELLDRLARAFTVSGEPYEFLLEEARIALITAAHRYEPARDGPFPDSVARFVVGQLKGALRDKRKIVRDDEWMRNL